MRRMKIRAKPNFGGGGGAPKPSSVPGKPSGIKVEGQGNQTQITSPPLKEEIVSSPSAPESNKPSVGAQGTSSDTLTLNQQEDTNKSLDNDTPAASSQNITSQPSLTSIQRVEPIHDGYSSEKLQEVVTDSRSEIDDTVSPNDAISVSPKSLESVAIPLPVTLDNSNDTVSDINSQSKMQSPVDVSVDMPQVSAEILINDTLNVSKDLQQDSDSKSAVSMRRKKLKVKPMFGGLRKGSVADKPKIKAIDVDAKLPNTASECVDHKPLVNQVISEENVSSPENTESNHQNSETQETVNTDKDETNISKKPNEQPVENIDSNKETDIIKDSPEYNKKHPTENELPMREETKITNTTPESPTLKDIKVEKMKEINTTVAINQPPTSPVENNPATQTTSNTNAQAAASKRRARIRAKPTLITKKKKEDSSSKDIKIKPVQETPVIEKPLQDKSPQDRVTKECDIVESNVAIEKPSQEVEECKFKPNIATVQKEAKCPETEVSKKHSCLSNTTDGNKESKETEHSQRIKREGMHVSFKSKAETPLHTNFKTSRKKKLNENKEIDPDLEVVDVVNTNAEKPGKKKIKQDSCEEILNSDDSTGDKENAASTPVTELSKQEKTKENNSPNTHKTKTKPTVVHGSKLFGKYERKLKVEDESPDKTKKQIFRARKDQFRKKMSEGALEHSKMTMFDLIYWNPVNNPMPGCSSSPKRNGSTGKGETDSVTSGTAEEQQVDDIGLDPTDPEPQTCPESPEMIKITDETPEEPTEEKTDSDKDEKDPPEDIKDKEPANEKDIFAPRVKIGPNGEIIIDEQSIKIQTTAAKNRDEVLSKAVVMEESGDSSHYGKWSKRRRRSCEWTVKETALFYKALSTVGTDFSLMETLIKWRTRAELKTKFKKEERNNRDLVDLALNDSTQFDMTVFEEESDYDPKEDRKAARQAERAEAKRKRMEMKQQDKIEEKEKKKLANKKNKAAIANRKKILRKSYRNRGRKRKKETFESENDDVASLYDSDSPSEEPENMIAVHPRVTVKRQQTKRRNSLVISEVTVTMETVKYDKPATCEVITESNSVEEHDSSQEFILPHVTEEVNSSDPHHDPSEKEIDPSKSPDNTLHRKPDLDPREEQENEMNILNQYSELPLNEGLPESHLIENIISDTTENDVNSSMSPIDDIEMSEPSTSTSMSKEAAGPQSTAKTITELQAENPPPESACDDDSQRVWHFPVSAIQTLDDGRQVIVVPTSSGHYNVPVPTLPPGTSNVVVMATDVPDSPGELIYHVYILSPLEAEES